MVFAFVQAEVDQSAAFADAYARVGGPTLVDDADLTDPAANARRSVALAYVRGYPDRALFTGFPSGVSWKLAAVSAAELGNFLYGAHLPAWIELTHGSRLVRDGAANVENVHVGHGVNQAILAIEAGLRQGQIYPALIAAAESADGRHVLLEGYKRATAHVRAHPPEREVEVIVGYSPRISDWHFF